ncbi:MAG: hypothetical protein GYA45_03155 [Pelolinea sp.]|jgi:hypothetical protein|nr:hypothetical protein [Pelolinea sp.]
MSYQEFYKYRNHPLAKEGYKRAKKIIHFLYFWYPINRNFALYRTQLKIIRDLLSLEEEILWHKKEIDKLRKEASTIAQISKSNLTDQLKIEISEKYSRAKEFEFNVQILKYFRWIFRYIGDGVAWRAFGYNREIIRALSDKQPVPFISNPQGLEKEMNFFLAIRKLGSSWLPVMHDSTNCLRTADFSVFKKGKLHRIIELKIRKSSINNEKEVLHELKNKREIRQQKRLNDIFDFLETGDLGKLREELVEGRSISSEIPEFHNFEYISNAIRNARKTGYGFEEPERGLLYLAWNFTKYDTNKIIEKAVQQFPHIFNSPLTFRSFGPCDDEKPYGLPITSMDMRPNHIIDLLFGNISVITFLNFKCLEENSKKLGIPLSIEKGNGNLRFYVKTNPVGEIREGLLDRLLIEGLSMNSFFGLINHILEEFEMKRSGELN